MDRRRWRQVLAVLAVVVAALVVFPLLAWTLVDMRNSRLLQREMDALKADGFALTLDEAKPPPVPEAQNAATTYLSLFQVRLDPKQGPISGGSDSGLKRFKLDKADMATALAARGMIESPEAQATLATLRRASAVPNSVFPVKWEQLFAALYPHLSQFRQGARLIAAQALLKAHDGKTAEALDWLAVSYRMADQVATEPTLLAQLVAFAIRGINEKAAREIVAQADVPPVASRSLYDQLARMEVDKPFQAALRMEVAMGLTFFEKMRHTPEDNAATMAQLLGEEVPPGAAILYRLMGSRAGAPLVKLEEANYARHMHRVMLATAKPYRQSSREMPPQVASSIGTIFASMMVPVYTKANSKRDQSLASARLLQIVLALKAYRHGNGRYPQSLSELPQRPPTEDTFSGQPFVYAREGGGFRLYSIGPNLRDDGGREPNKPGKILEEGDIVWACPR